MPLVDAEPCTLAIVRRRDVSVSVSLRRVAVAVAVAVADELITQCHSGSAS